MTNKRLIKVFVGQGLTRPQAISYIAEGRKFKFSNKKISEIMSLQNGIVPLMYEYEQSLNELSDTFKKEIHV